MRISFNDDGMSFSFLINSIDVLVLTIQMFSLQG